MFTLPELCVIKIFEKDVSPPLDCIALHCSRALHFIALEDFELHGVTSQQGTSFCQQRFASTGGCMMIMVVIMSDGNYDNDVGDDDCNVLRAPEVVQQIKEHCKKFVTKMINLLQPQCRSEVLEKFS